MEAERLEVYQAEQAAAYLREITAKAKWTTDRMAAQVEQAEAERLQAISNKIVHTVSALYFTERSVERLQWKYDAALKDPSYSWPELQAEKNALDIAKRQVSEFKAYLDEQRTAGVYSAESIDAEIADFAKTQGAPERLAKAASAAAKKIENDAKPQPIPGGPLVTYPCPKCDSNLPSAGVALHHGPNGWCVINPRKAYASGRDAFWLISEGGCTTQELLDAGIAVPDLG